MLTYKNAQLDVINDMKELVFLLNSKDLTDEEFYNTCEKNNLFGNYIYPLRPEQEGFAAYREGMEICAEAYKRQIRAELYTAIDLYSDMENEIVLSATDGIASAVGNIDYMLGRMNERFYYFSLVHELTKDWLEDCMKGVSHDVPQAIFEIIYDHELEILERICDAYDEYTDLMEKLSSANPYCENYKSYKQHANNYPLRFGERELFCAEYEFVCAFKEDMDNYLSADRAKGASAFDLYDKVTSRAGFTLEDEIKKYGFGTIEIERNIESMKDLEESER